MFKTNLTMISIILQTPKIEEFRLVARKLSSDAEDLFPFYYYNIRKEICHCYAKTKKNTSI